MRVPSTATLRLRYCPARKQGNAAVSESAAGASLNVLVVGVSSRISVTTSWSFGG